MTEHMTKLPGSELVGLVPNDSKLQCLLAGSKIDHSSRGVGLISRVELRGTYTPLIHIEFGAGVAQIPLENFANGRFSITLRTSILESLKAESDLIRADELSKAKRTEECRLKREAEAKRERERILLEKEREFEELRILQAEQSRLLRESLPSRHRERIEKLGMEYKGVRAITKFRNRRITHCWSCTNHLDNAVDVECAICGWILCTCSACGCGRD